MVKDLLETGTPFDYGRHDEWEKGVPSVGLSNNPDKNQRFVNKDKMPNKLEKGKTLFKDEDFEEE